MINWVKVKRDNVLHPHKLIEKHCTLCFSESNVNEIKKEDYNFVDFVLLKLTKQSVSK